MHNKMLSRGREVRLQRVVRDADSGKPTARMARVHVLAPWLEEKPVNQANRLLAAAHEGRHMRPIKPAL
jgi:hypothetical protein